jgi:hypothetical protein
MAMTPPANTPESLHGNVTPTWIDIAGYTIEKLHTNVLARSLKSGTPAANELAAALWKLASGEEVPGVQITDLHVRCEHPLGKGTHSVVDLLLDFAVGGGARHLAVEVKVDGPPNGAQLATMAKSLMLGPHRKLVLLCLGGAQACRIEAERDLQAQDIQIPRWSVKDILNLSYQIEAASPAPGVTRDWLAELANEECRRTGAFEDASLVCDRRYRYRLQDVYRYRLAAEALDPDGGFWDVSVQPFGVVMTERSMRREVTFEGKKVAVYLQVVDGVLRVKAGAWFEPADPRAVTKAVLPALRAALEKGGFMVDAAKQTTGRSVSLLSLDQHDADLSSAAFVPKLRRAFKAWSTTAWPK